MCRLTRAENESAIANIEHESVMTLRIDNICTRRTVARRLRNIVEIRTRGKRGILRKNASAGSRYSRTPLRDNRISYANACSLSDVCIYARRINVPVPLPSRAPAHAIAEIINRYISILELISIDGEMIRYLALVDAELYHRFIVVIN